MVRVDEGISKVGVSVMGFFDVTTRDFLFGSPDTALGFESAHLSIQFGVAEPEKSRHRGAVVEERSIANDDGASVCVSYDDDECTTRFSSEELGDDLAVRIQCRWVRHVISIRTTRSATSSHQPQQNDESDEEWGNALEHRSSRYILQVERLGGRSFDLADRRLTSGRAC